MEITIDKNKLNEYENIILDDNVLFQLNAIPQMIINKDRFIIRVNQKFNLLFDYNNDEILGKRTSLLTPTIEIFEQYQQYFEQTKNGIIKSEELQYKKKDGTLFWVRLEGNTINQKNDELLILWSLIDITKEVNYRNKLEKLVSIDPMTKLYNRRFFEDMSVEIINLKNRNKEKLSIMMIDIDNFKKINDTYGHDVGDKVIIYLANILQKSFRKSDIICRWGGEEFIILLPNTSKNNTNILANNVCKNCYDSTVNISENTNIKFTISIGVSIIRENEESVEFGIKRSDVAMYKAKNNGKNQVILN